jgi:aspartate/methionine/tyrosine aminotransferase
MKPYNIFEHLRAADLYTLHHGKEPFFLSDWNNNSSEVVIPTKLLELAHNNALLHITKYTETHIVRGIMEEHKRLLRGTFGIDLKEHLGLVFGNATAALSIFLQSLRAIEPNLSIGTVSPSYYSIDNVCNTLSIPVKRFFLEHCESFLPDMNRLREFIEETSVRCLVLTNPVYCAGCIIPDETIKDILSLCEENGVWVLIDTAFSGLNWTDASKISLNGSLISLVCSFKNAILIDSPTKRLFLNGLKLGIAYGPEIIIEKMRHLSDCMLGNITREQICLLRLLYSTEHRGYLEEVCFANMGVAKSTYQSLTKVIPVSAELTKPDCGIHCMIFSRSLACHRVDSLSTSLAILAECGVVALPVTDFNYSSISPFGVRVNLLKDVSILSHYLFKTAEKNFHAVCTD